MSRRLAPRQAAATIALLGGLVGYGLGIAVTYLPRDIGLWEDPLASVPTGYIHATVVVLSFCFAAGFLAVYGRDLVAAIDDSQSPAVGVRE